ncbi:MAG: hypothetical protein Kow0020_00030 [Wenzhouxiangellaceae bacterium]
MTRLADPLYRLLGLIERLPAPGYFVLLIAGLIAGWWLYVPVHELMHAFGCMIAGGEVQRLEIARPYGGAWLAAWFDFVEPGSEYAGRLSGFDTGGSDWVYQATVLAPYLLTVFPGLWLWRRLLAPEVAPGPLRVFAAGGLLPVVAAPLLSLTGDYYESGSIVVSDLLAGLAGRETALWRSDDLFRLIASWPGPLTLVDGLGIAAGFVTGLALALATLWLGVWIAEGIDEVRRRRAS